MICSSSDPLSAVGLALRAGNATTILVANMTPKPQSAAITDGPRLELEPYAIETAAVAASALGDG